MSTTLCRKSLFNEFQELARRTEMDTFSWDLYFVITFQYDDNERLTLAIVAISLGSFTDWY